MAVLSAIDEGKLLELECVDGFGLLVREEENVVLLLEVFLEFVESVLLGLVCVMNAPGHGSDVLDLRSAVVSDGL